MMRRYIVEVTRTGYREVEAVDCEDAELTGAIIIAEYKFVKAR